ncbi:MAG: 50S ribosomal protein L25 [Planctomycetota bacterium]|nr:50S ribosomal protein L25 [Planctomycetota bacterium]
MAHELKAVIRTEKGRLAARRLRHKDQIPAVVYAEGKPGTMLAIPRTEWQRILTSGDRVVSLKLEGGDKQALIKEVQYDPLGEQTMHVDFTELRAGQKVRVAVAVVTKGVPKGHINGGVLQQPVHTVHVECLPTQIPEKIVVDAEPLDVDDVIHVKDLKLPEGVAAVDAPDIVLIAVHVPRVEEPVAAVEAGPTEPEVLTARKEEEPAAGEGAAAEGKAPEKKEEKKKEDKKKEEKK